MSGTTNETRDEVIGFIGLGNMGWNMASHLARSGYEVIGYDANEETARRFAAERGAEPPALLDLARATVIWTMLPTGDIVRDVLTSGGGKSLLAALRPGTLHIDTTSSPPASTRDLGAVERESGVTLVDCGVSGGHRGAVEGNLVFMVGGDDPVAVQRAEVLLGSLGNKTFLLGGLGLGHTMKSINNAISAACFAATCEGLILGHELGLDLATMLDVVNVSTGQNDAAARSIPKIIDESYRRTFSLGLFTKDVRIAKELAGSAGAAAPVLDLVHARLSEAIDVYGYDVDHTFAFKLWQSQRSSQGEGEQSPRLAEGRSDS